MELSELYFGPNSGKVLGDFFEEHEDSILSLLDDEISSSLTRFYMGSPEEQHQSLFKALGLVYGRKVSESGMRIISAYPLLGDGQESPKAYPVEFFPFLIAVLGKGNFTLRTLSTIPSLFPSMGEEKAQEVAQRTLEAFLTLGISRKTGRRWRLVDQNAEAFLKLDEISRLSYVLSPNEGTSERLRTAKALSLYFLTNGVYEEDWPQVSRLVGGAAGKEIPLKDLRLFSVVEKDNGFLSGREYQGELFSSPVISSDMVLSYRGRCNLPLHRIAEPLISDQLSQWTITKDSIRRALDKGLTKEDIKETLDRFSLSNTPETLLQRISSWAEQYAMVRISRATVLEANPRLSMVISTLPRIQEYIISRPAENLFLMDNDREEEWREILVSTGLDMLPGTKGPLFSEEEERLSFTRTSEPLDFPLEREVSFDQKGFQELMDSAVTLLERSAILSHCSFFERAPFRLEGVSGLFFQEKLHLIEKAIYNKDKLYVVYDNGREDILTPLSIDRTNEEEPRLTAKEGIFEIGSFWKTSTIPSLIKRAD